MENYYVGQSLERPFHDLRMACCGREKCQPLHSWGPVVRPTYIIHYILEGKGIFKTGEETWHLHEKEGFLIEPETQTFYQADAVDPWTYCWIGFEGDLAPVLVKELGLRADRPVFCCDQKKELEDVFRTIFEGQKSLELSDLVLESQLYRFFAILMKDLQVGKISGKNKNSDYTREAIRYIRNQYFTPIKVSDIADHVGINRSYLYTLFVKEMGMTPNEYLASFRLTRAAEVLTITDYSIEQIAYSCGYQDSVVFSKAFKRKYTVSPNQYRKAQREKHRLLEEKNLDKG